MSAAHDGREPAKTFGGVIALDGPSGTGKSTVARRLASRLRVRYLDTGAMYRAATVAVLDAGRDPLDAQGVLAVVRAARIEISTDPDHVDVYLDGRQVNAEIRSAPVTAAVSPVSAVPEVREILVTDQRRIIGDGGIVVEGRDIGTVVWPNARPKVFLTAHQSVRAARRADQLGGGDLGEIERAIERRDRYDSTRTTSPLVRAADAIVLDTTELSVDGVVDRLVDLATHEVIGQRD